MGVIIRTATIKDLPKITELHQRFIHEQAMLYDQAFYQLSDTAPKEWSLWAYEKLKGGELGLFVAEENTQILGYVSGWVEHRAPVYALRKIGFLSNMYILPEYRGAGTGKKLNRVILKWFKEMGLEYVELNVDTRAKEAIAAWNAFGYNEVGKRMRIKI